MSIELHVACRRDPASLAALAAACAVADVELGGPQTIRAWSPRAHATLLLRERDVAAVVTFRGRPGAALVADYAELVARAFEGVIVRDGVVVDVDPRPLEAAELATAWSRLDQIRAAHERARAHARLAWAAGQPAAAQRDSHA